ncbi:MAG: hypothetical protein MZW92_05635 [Comamonadaceae bacterium]|nr:hypothetical protein [Comamonadaceae bacterium]
MFDWIEPRGSAPRRAALLHRRRRRIPRRRAGLPRAVAGEGQGGRCRGARGSSSTDAAAPLPGRLAAPQRAAGGQRRGDPHRRGRAHPARAHRARRGRGDAASELPAGSVPAARARDARRPRPGLARRLSGATCGAGRAWARPPAPTSPALLLLGEPEAVVAVAHAPGLTDELARRVWWTMPTMEIARCMLARDEVAQGPMGRVLADFLVEHMPFEESADANLETIRLVLGAGLADAATRAMLWSKGQRQPHYYIGFLEQMADDLPQDAPARDDHAPAALQALAADGNPFAILLSRCLSASGQTFLKAAAEALAKPATHRIVYDLFDVIGAYFESVRPRHAAANDVDAMAAAAESRGGLDEAQRGHADALLAALPQFAPQLRAMLFLSQLSQDAADQVLTRTTAVGPLMRRKLEPVIAPIAAHIQVLRGADHA